MIDPEKDGADHINVYSKGQTRLGRLLSNFADTPFELPNIGKFKSVEGYWFFICTGNHEFKDHVGWKAKQRGKEVKHIRECPSKDELRAAYKAKLENNPHIQHLLNNNELPLKHYYVYGDKVVVPAEWQWTAELWNEFKQV